MIRYLPLIFVSLAACAQAQNPGEQPKEKFEVPAAAEDLFSGSWQNDRGSQVVFDNSGPVLSGHYQTNAGQPDKSQKFPLTGFTHGDQITFTVNFKGYGSMTSWTGQLSNDTEGPYIRTLWNLTRNVEDADESKDLWKSITAGASDFRPLKP